MTQDRVIFPHRATMTYSSARKRSLPPLESGDHLSRAEFERRYQAMPDCKKAELVEGVVYVASPLRALHGEAYGHMVGWLWNYYCIVTVGVSLYDNATIRLDDENEVQPDVAVCRAVADGGKTRMSADGYLEGPPELIVEIAASSASYDLHDKLHVYRRHGVREYIVWRVYDDELDWFALQAGEYVRLDADEDGILRSRVFPGLHLHVQALLEGDGATVLQELRQGLENQTGHRP